MQDLDWKFNGFHSLNSNGKFHRQSPYLRVIFRLWVTLVRRFLTTIRLTRHWGKHIRSYWRGTFLIKSSRSQSSCISETECRLLERAWYTTSILNLHIFFFYFSHCNSNISVLSCGRKKNIYINLIHNI